MPLDDARKAADAALSHTVSKLDATYELGFVEVGHDQTRVDEKWVDRGPRAGGRTIETCWYTSPGWVAKTDELGGAALLETFASKVSPPFGAWAFRPLPSGPLVRSSYVSSRAETEESVVVTVRSVDSGIEVRVVYTTVVHVGDCQ